MRVQCWNSNENSASRRPHSKTVALRLLTPTMTMKSGRTWATKNLRKSASYEPICNEVKNAELLTLTNKRSRRVLARITLSQLPTARQCAQTPSASAVLLHELTPTPTNVRPSATPSQLVGHQRQPTCKFPKVSDRLGVIHSHRQ